MKRNRRNGTSAPQHDGNSLVTRRAGPTGHSTNGAEKPFTLITGGAGFIGTNLAERLLRTGKRVLIFDNLSRRGSEANLAWLSARYGGSLEFQHGDVRDYLAVEQAVRRSHTIFHLAAQVAVTSSLTDPRFDFDVNAGGTLQLLEAVRQSSHPPILLFTSTNKVYGKLADLELVGDGQRYSPRNSVAAANGISEKRTLDFHSPYGCSKGASDQYILDYARTFHIPAVVFRMSCIYGPHQNGTEDQGWVAHFLIRANEGEPIRIYGDGMQVRDLLFVEDLLDAFELATSHIEQTAGSAFNIGGGPTNTISLLELLRLMEDMFGLQPRAEFAPWRHADQRYYVSDTRLFHSLMEWKPRIGVREGLQILQRWLTQDKRLHKVARAGPLQQHAVA